MIAQASIFVTHDGGALIVLPPTGMDLSKETVVSVEGGRLRIGQNATWFVSVELREQELVAAIRDNPDLSIAESDADGFEFYAIVRELKR